MEFTRAGPEFPQGAAPKANNYENLLSLVFDYPCGAISNATKNCRKTEKSSFSQKLFFSQFMLKLGNSGGVRGEGMDHTETLSRTLAGFGLTWHRKVHFSRFDGKLGFWISPTCSTRGFWLNGLRRKSILKNGPPPKTKSGNWKTIKLCNKCYFLYAFL